MDEAIVAAVSQEHPVSLRGVYYRVVSAGAVDKTELGYRLVGRRLLALRRDGRVPYSWITDGTRWISKPDSWTDLDEMLDAAGASYRRQLWNDQQVEVHLFTEKDAISGVVMPITARWDVPLGVVRGYSSESFAYSVAESVRHAINRNKRVYLYQLGDHDPSGVDAWRDLQQKVLGFLGDLAEPSHHDDGSPYSPVTFERLAVTQAQIALYQLPTRPTKTKDSRSGNFVDGSVEVDAIAPTVLRQIVDRAIVQHIDVEALRLTQMAEQSERAMLFLMRGAS